MYNVLATCDGPVLAQYRLPMYGTAGVIGSDVPWLECPACNALAWVITVTE